MFATLCAVLATRLNGRRRTQANRSMSHNKASNTMQSTRMLTGDIEAGNAHSQNVLGTSNLPHLCQHSVACPSQVLQWGQLLLLLPPLLPLRKHATAAVAPADTWGALEIAFGGSASRFCCPPVVLLLPMRDPARDVDRKRC